MTEHHPPHIFLDNSCYIITSVVKDRSRLLAKDGVKELVKDKLRSLLPKFDITLYAWVILDNHYHILLKTRLGSSLSIFIGRLHGSTSREINLRDGVTGRHVWTNYWDSVIRDEADLWTRFNYIHQNPVKHGYVRKLDNWSFSSYGYYQRTKGEEWLRDCWERYPVIDFLQGDDSKL